MRFQIEIFAGIKSLFYLKTFLQKKTKKDVINFQEEGVLEREFQGKPVFLFVTQEVEKVEKEEKGEVYYKPEKPVPQDFIPFGEVEVKSSAGQFIIGLSEGNLIRPQREKREGGIFMKFLFAKTMRVVSLTRGGEILIIDFHLRNLYGKIKCDWYTRIPSISFPPEEYQEEILKSDVGGESMYEIVAQMWRIVNARGEVEFQEEREILFNIIREQRELRQQQFEPKPKVEFDKGFKMWPEQVEKLKKAGIDTLEKFTKTSPEKLNSLIGPKSTSYLVEKAREYLKKEMWKRGTAVDEKTDPKSNPKHPDTEFEFLITKLANELPDFYDILVEEQEGQKNEEKKVTLENEKNFLSENLLKLENLLRNKPRNGFLLSHEELRGCGFGTVKIRNQVKMTIESTLFSTEVVEVKKQV